MKRTFAKKVIASAVVSAMILSLTPVSSNIAGAKAQKVKKITLSAKKKTLYTGEKLQLTVKSVKPAKASKAVKWKTSKKSIATVNGKGLVTAKKKGSVKITAVSKTNKKVKAVCTIKVKKGVANKSIVMNSKSLSLKAGASAKLSVKWNPTKTTVKKLTWTSSNTKVVTVKNGTVKAIAAGRATITATNTYGKKATCQVNVAAVAPNQPTVVTPNQPAVAPTQVPAPSQPTVAPTEVPTTAPTNEPTTAPTEKPTTAPTVVPTAAPTTAPTTAPTAVPTVVPTTTPVSTEVTPVVDGDYSTYTFDTDKKYKATASYNGKEYSLTSLSLADQIDEVLSVFAKSANYSDADAAYESFYTNAKNIQKTVAKDVAVRVTKEANTNKLTVSFSGNGVPANIADSSLTVEVIKNNTGKYHILAIKDENNYCSLDIEQKKADTFTVTNIHVVRNGETVSKAEQKTADVVLQRDEKKEVVSATITTDRKQFVVLSKKDADNQVNEIQVLENGTEIYDLKNANGQIVVKIKTTYLDKILDRYDIHFFDVAK